MIVDVREPHEWAIGTIDAPDVRFIPVGDVPARMHELDSARRHRHCSAAPASARRARSASCSAAGFRKLKNLTGGILAWSDEVDPIDPEVLAGSRWTDTADEASVMLASSVLHTGIAR